MHQIIHLSPVGSFTPARGKTVQKNREVSGVNLKIDACQYFIVCTGQVFLIECRKLPKCTCYSNNRN